MKAVLLRKKRFTIHSVFLFRYHRNAKQLAGMLSEKPSSRSMLSYGLKLAMVQRDHFALKAAQKLGFVQFYSLDVLLGLLISPVVFLSLLK